MGGAVLAACSAAPTLERLAKDFPVVALTGLGQSGKTTLAKSVFSGKAYVSLENPDEQDPKRFLQRFSNGAVLEALYLKPRSSPSCSNGASTQFAARW